MTGPDCIQQPAPSVSATDELTRCAQRLKAALASGDQRVDRLAEARTTVSLRDADRGAQLLLRFDRRPVSAGVSDDPAEIEVTLAPAHFLALAEGALPLAEKILHGEIAYSGPVRKLLAVVPVLNSLLATNGQPSPRAPEHSSSAAVFEEHTGGSVPDDDDVPDVFRHPRRTPRGRVSPGSGSPAGRARRRRR
jgi:hypothetical protein